MYSPKDRESIVPRSEDGGYRSCFRRDYGRLVHCPAFRRLQGKTQVFPWAESDFSRNRLTHSIEVAQIAKTIALKFNANYEREFWIDTDLVETAALAHDLGHPPFGHTGEQALNELMSNAGGFEGNAQTLRILTRLEKKAEGKESMYASESGAGLNLTYRSIASIIKYDSLISEGGGAGVAKGYYLSEEDVVQWVKQSVLQNPGGKLYTIECAIMDLADDIAYSTYDIEDALKAGFISFTDLVFIDEVLAEEIAREISAIVGDEYSPEDIYNILSRALEYPLQGIAKKYSEWEPGLVQKIGEQIANLSSSITNDGRHRTLMTSKLVSRFVESVGFELDLCEPALSKVCRDRKMVEEISVLKLFTRLQLINSAQFKIYDTRGKYILRRIFREIETNAEKLLPEDYRERYREASNVREQKRTICDYIASMTDRYCVELYTRLFSENPQTIFKPL